MKSALFPKVIALSLLVILPACRAFPLPDGSVVTCVEFHARCYSPNLLLALAAFVLVALGILLLAKASR